MVFQIYNFFTMLTFYSFLNLKDKPFLHPSILVWMNGRFFLLINIRVLNGYLISNRIIIENVQYDENLRNLPICRTCCTIVGDYTHNVRVCV